MADKITLTNLVNLQNENSAVNAINNNNAKITTAFDNTLSRDGTAPNQMGASLDMNSNRILNLPQPLNSAEPVTYGQFNSAVIGKGNVPVGGTTGQILSKNSNLDYDSKWITETLNITGGNNILVTGANPTTISTVVSPTFTQVGYNGATSGTTTVMANTIASGTLTLPVATDTLVGKATTDTFTNKTLDTAGTGNLLKINGTTVNATVGSGNTVVLSTSPVLVTPALGTPVSGVATNLTGTAAGLTAGNVTTNANLTGVITSVGNATSIASQTGTGTKFVVDTTPTLITPIIGVATATSVNKMAITAPATSSTLAVANSKTFTANNTLTLAGTDATTITFQGTDTYVGRTTTDTLTNKTLTTPVISSISNTGLLTLPTIADTLVGRTTTDTLTNKTIAGGSNTISGVALSSLASQGAYTLVGNSTGSSAVPTAIDITALTSKPSPISADIVLIQDSTASNAYKRTTVGALASAGSVSSIAGNTGAFTLAGGITNTVNQIQLSLTNATANINTSSATGTASTSAVMAGLGSTCKITPTYSGRLKVEFHGRTQNSSTAEISYQLRYGTGVAPSNGAAASGTTIDLGSTNYHSTAGEYICMYSGGIVTGLTPGTQYWFDLTQLVTAGTGTMTNINFNAMEF